LNSEKLKKKFGIKASITKDGLVVRGTLSNHDNGGIVRWSLKSKIGDGKVINVYKCYHC